jgi:hypothetical protein
MSSPTFRATSPRPTCLHASTSRQFVNHAYVRKKGGASRVSRSPSANPQTSGASARLERGLPPRSPLIFTGATLSANGRIDAKRMRAGPSAASLHIAASTAAVTFT